MIPLTISQVVAMTSGSWIRQAGDVSITGISTDSRLLRPGELFIALRGRHFDGNDFAAEALARGAAGILVERIPPSGGNASPGNVIQVADGIVALQDLATAIRRRVRVRAIGITGSTGKTIVKDMLAAILTREFRILATPLSFHGQVGLPLTLLDLNPDHEVAILELGISRKGEMAKLAAMAGLDIAILTNVSEAHLEHLESLATIAAEKSRIFTGFNDEAHLAILNADDPWGRSLAGSLTCRVMTFGINEEADLRAIEIVPVGRQGAWFSLAGSGTADRYYLNAPGRHNIYNALAAIAAARALGVPDGSIRAGLEEFHPPQMRLEIHTSSVLEENVTIINDSYNASPASMKGALDALVEMAGSNRTIAVLGDMLELGNFSFTAHETIGGEVFAHRIDLLMTIGRFARTIGRKAIELGMAESAVIHCDDQVDAAERLRGLLAEGDFVLFKGSRMMQLDRLAAQFIGGIRPTKLIIDLEAVAHNMRAIREIVGPTVAIMAVVKSGGYGHDSRKVAQVVLDNGAEYLAVAVPDEGIFLRRAGFSRTPILVMGPTLPEEAPKLVRYGLAQSASSLRLLGEINREAKKRQVRIPVHLKIDTGMGRIGIQPGELPEFLDALARLDHVVVEGVMTHLSSADDSAEADFTRSQIAAFSRAIAAVEARGHVVRWKHAAASSGILNYPEAWFTMVRPGIMIYGHYPAATLKAKIKLRPVASFVTKIAYLKTVPAGASISYGRSFITSRESLIATLPVGYYDGYNRHLSNKASVLIRARRAPVVGNVTMDMTMVDVTDLPAVAVGDEVVLFGRQGDQEIELEELAELCGTINYELIGQVSARVSRVYRNN